MRRSPRAAVALLTVPLAFGACAGDEPRAREDAPAVLVPVPQPDLSRADPSVRDQLETARAHHEAVLRNLGTEEGERAASFGDLGMRYHAYDLQGPALACYRNATLLAPEEGRWHYLLAALLQSLGRLEEAREELLAARRSLPADAPLLRRLGQVELSLGRPHEARTVLEAALEADSGCAGTFYGLGEAARQAGDLEAAVGYFERGLALEPSAVQIHYPLGQVLRQLGRSEAADPHLEVAASLEVVPRSWPECDDPILAELRALTTGASALILRGISAEAAGADAVGLEELRRAARLEPQDPSARMNFAAALERRGDLGAARQEYEAALALDPDNPALLFDLARLLQRLGEDDAARALLERALELHPAFVEARLTLATALQRRGDPAAALPHYERVLEVEPGNVPARLQRALALGALGRAPEGIAAVDSVIEDFPGLDFATRLNTASALALLGDRTRARLLLSQLLGEAPDDAAAARIQVNLGVLLLQGGDPSAAAQSFSAALELDPDSAQARIGLERARQALAR